MTAPATANRILHYVCMECHHEYKTLLVERDLGVHDVSHGYCPGCEPKVMERWFGSRAFQEQVEARR